MTNAKAIAAIVVVSVGATVGVVLMPSGGGTAADPVTVDVEPGPCGEGAIVEDGCIRSDEDLAAAVRSFRSAYRCDPIASKFTGAGWLTVGYIAAGVEYETRMLVDVDWAMACIDSSPGGCDEFARNCVSGAD